LDLCYNFVLQNWWYSRQLYSSSRHSCSPFNIWSCQHNHAASYLLLKMLNKVQSLNHPDAITVATKQLLDSYYSQGLEICWRDNYTCPSLQEYKKLIKRSKDMTEPWVGFTWSCKLAYFIAWHSVCTFECSHIQCCSHSLFSEIKMESLIIFYHCKSSEWMHYIE